MITAADPTFRRDAMPSSTVDLSSAPRVVVGTAADLIYKVGLSMLGADRVPTAKANAWAAVCADQERARIREENARILLAVR
ncbi:hypothetical protein ACFO1B_50570 [Dactylosporangium siamense]|uniref:Uncharacterized protein n=1 Tax=Dactylosporangium siamense TaxID=685454 RepID=A0A919UI54_9ACTN|nr:hypothetical protein [Dactylosporangium siamense]GIG53066.1 hypothetical protein Dsi01nite_111070 [Dactylosporangium siamense]